MRNIKKYILLFAVVFYSTIIIAQSKQLAMPFTYYSINDGLSASTIDCIFKDKRGFIWLGTQDGLNRFDGYEFKKYFHQTKDSTTLGENYVRSIVEDNDGNLWICSYSGGISFYNQHTDKFTVYKHQQNNKNSLIDNRTVCVLHTKDNKIWIGTEHGLSTYDIATKTFSNYFNSNIHTGDDCSITSLCQDNSGAVWAGSTKGLLFKFQLNKNGEINISATKIHSSVYSINAIVCNPKGNIFIGTNNGLYTNNKSNGFREVSIFKSNTITNKKISVLEASNTDVIWVGTETDGLFKFKINNETAEHYVSNPTDIKSLKTNAVTALLHDNQNNLWVGTDAGLSVHFPLKEKVKSFTKDANNSLLKVGEVWSIYNEDSLTIVGTSRDLLQLNFVTQHIEIVKGAGTKINKNYYCIYKDANNFLVGTSDGLVALQRKQNKITSANLTYRELDILKHKKICNITQYDKNNLWIGTYEDGLYRWNTKEHRVYTYVANTQNSIASEVINSVYKDNDNKFWFGTDNGFSYYLPAKDAFVNYTTIEENNHSINKQYVYHFYDDGSNLWIATYGGGLNCMNKKTKTFTYYKTENGLSSNDVYCIVADDRNNLWLSTNNGISCFNITTHQFKNYNENDGTQSNEFNHWASFKNKNGEIFFGGINGLTAINPTTIQIDPMPPILQITNVSVMGTPYNSSTHLSEIKEIELPYYQNKISFQFAALSYTSTRKNQYQYVLEGLENTYNSIINDHTATYNNLSPGKYIFKVIGSNSDGIWNKNAASITIIIRTPFYATWWFKCIVALIVIGILYSFYRFRINQILKLQAMRNRIAQDLHDDIGATLGSINIFSEVAKNRLNANSNKVGEALNNISEASKEIIEKMNDIIWTVNPNNDSTVELVNRMKSFAVLILSQTDIEYNFSIDAFETKIKFTMMQRKNIFLICKEAIHNAVKYSSCKKIEIILTSVNRTVMLQIIDDGKGFDVNNTTSLNGNGLKNMNTRAKEISAYLIVNSTPNKGTTVTLTINS